MFFVFFFCVFLFCVFWCEFFGVFWCFLVVFGWFWVGFLIGLVIMVKKNKKCFDMVQYGLVGFRVVSLCFTAIFAFFCSGWFLHTVLL